jgi:hypothetical protein
MTLRRGDEVQKRGTLPSQAPPITTWCVFTLTDHFCRQRRRLYSPSREVYWPHPGRSDRLNVSNTERTCEQYRPVKGLVLASTKRNRLSVTPRFLLTLTVGEATYLAGYQRRTEL